MNEIRKALYARLAGDAALTALLATPTSIYHSVAPQDAQTPFVTLAKQAGDPRWQFAGAHVQSEVWTVKAVDQNSTASRVEDIAARVDVLLTDAPLTVTGRVLLAIYRASDVEYTETSGGDLFFHVGAMFRVETQPA